MIDIYKRYQNHLYMSYLFPKNKDNTCACGCGKRLKGKKRKWYSDKCRLASLNHYLIIKGNTQAIRYNLFNIDMGFCRNCGVYDDNWQADHIIPVYKGGGGCDISNLQTLCYNCHQEKTLLDRVPDSYNSKASSIYVAPTLFDTIWANDKHVCKNIIR